MITSARCILGILLLPALASASEGGGVSRIIVGIRPAEPGRALTVPARERTRQLGQRLGMRLGSTLEVGPTVAAITLDEPLDAAALAATLARLNADPDVEFAEVDQRRYPRVAPGDPLYASQWYLQGSEVSATHFEAAWDATTGSADTVIAVLDTGIRFEHPDLAARVVPGYDFVLGESATSFVSANDGNGRDGDASDPGDWVTSAESQSGPLAGCFPMSSSWHGTRVAAIVGAATNNGTGMAGGTWNGKVLPVRVLGKCGGYDSDIVAGMRWAAGLPVAGVPSNPNPARILNLSLGSTGSCPTVYRNVIAELSAAGVLVIASAGNSGDQVDAPGNCAGVLAVGGLRHVGTKVGYSSFGPEVGISAPAGNCPSADACTYSLVTATNTGQTVPVSSSYTDEGNFNIGTSFSTPIVAAVAGLMHAVNDGLTTGEFIARIRSGARPFPAPQSGLPTCPSQDNATGQCNCTTTTCGAGIADAPGAVSEARRPVARIVKPDGNGAGQNVPLDGSSSAAARNRSISSYSWTAVSGNPAFVGATNGPLATVTVPASGLVTVRLAVADDIGQTDARQVTLGASDSDGDGLFDAIDNCTLVPNPTQLDADSDGYGNICDADLNNSGSVTAADFAILRTVLNLAASTSPTAALSDLNGSGTVTAADYAILRARINTMPGPSGFHP